ncbi:MAG: pyrroline-5-carboxylate reductase, partial [Desulfobacterales bacterium]
MFSLNKKIGLIGCGNMGEAIVGAMIKGHIADPNKITVSDALMDRLDYIRSTYRVSVTPENTDVFFENDVVILAVKPQQMGPLLSDISRHGDYRIAQRKIVISIAAGIPLKTIERALYAPLDPAATKQLPLIRVMPNTPALVLAGISGMSANQNAIAEDRAVAQTILSAMGKVIEFDEKDLDAVTALSGSGPAYVFYLVESMIAAGIAI